jgi:hypothetical protein
MGPPVLISESLYQPSLAAWFFASLLRACALATKHARLFTIGRCGSHAGGRPTATDIVL